MFGYFDKEQTHYFELTKDVVVPYSKKDIGIRITEAKTSIKEQKEKALNKMIAKQQTIQKDKVEVFLPYLMEGV